VLSCISPAFALCGVRAGVIRESPLQTRIALDGFKRDPRRYLFLILFLKKRNTLALLKNRHFQKSKLIQKKLRCYDLWLFHSFDEECSSVYVYQAPYFKAHVRRRSRGEVNVRLLGGFALMFAPGSGIKRWPVKICGGF